MVAAPQCTAFLSQHSSAQRFGRNAAVPLTTKKLDQKHETQQCQAFLSQHSSARSQHSSAQRSVATQQCTVATQQCTAFCRNAAVHSASRQRRGGRHCRGQRGASKGSPMRRRSSGTAAARGGRKWSTKRANKWLKAAERGHKWGGDQQAGQRTLNLRTQPLGMQGRVPICSSAHCRRSVPDRMANGPRLRGMYLHVQCFVYGFRRLRTGSGCAACTCTSACSVFGHQCDRPSAGVCAVAHLGECSVQDAPGLGAHPKRASALTGLL